MIPRPAEFVQFVQLFNRGDYFESHEVLEGLWRRTEGPEKLFFQGLIQAAVALHHFTNGNETGCAYESRKAMEKLRHYPRVYLGLAVETFARDFESYLRGKAAHPPFIILA